METRETRKAHIYYDSTCRLCIGIVNKIERSSQKKEFESIPVGQQLPPGISEEDAMRDVYAVDEHGTVRKGADALLYIISRYPRWRWLATIGKLPVMYQLLWMGYRIVADTRRWIF
jgi:predicted DCC family thiol-disulfide oxidoreductase YuxK